MAQGIRRVGRGSGQAANEDAVANHRAGREHGAVADEGAFADVIMANGHRAMPYARSAQGDAVRDEALVADGEQVGRDEGGGGDFGAVAELGAQQPIPRRQIDRGVERAQHFETQVKGLVHEPFAEVVRAVERVASRLHFPQQQPFEQGDLQGEEHDERQSNQRSQQQVPVVGVEVVQLVHQHNAGEQGSDYEDGEDQQAEGVQEAKSATAGGQSPAG